MQFIRDSVIHLMRGQVYDIAEKRIFTMGGASSHDIDAGILEPDDPDFRRKHRQLDKQMAHYRINHVSWWKEELPDDTEYETAKKTWMPAAGEWTTSSPAAARPASWILSAAASTNTTG